MARDSDKSNKRRPIIIRKEEVVEGGHHGGAWKVAYADFVTAMMAFFLLMWLLNATTEAQRKGLADYFSPTTALSRNLSGNGQPFGGHTPFDDGALASDRGAVQVTVGQAPVVPDADDDDSDTPAKPRVYRKDAKDYPNGEQDPAGPATEEAGPVTAAAGVARAAGTASDGTAIKPVDRKPTTADKTQASANGAERAVDHPQADGNERQQTAATREKQAFAQAAQQIRDAVRDDPGLAEIARQLTIDLTPEGLRIQILDEERSPMFATGSAAPNERARLLLQKVTPVLARLPEGISIAGHTDATPYRGPDRSNWELSVERANATRRLLLDAGLPEARIRTVTGSADRDPLLPADPMAAANRRIAIIVLRNRPAASVSPASPPPALP